MQILIYSVLLSLGSAVTIPVKDAASLTSALKKAKPGDVISLADGTYNGKFSASTSGSEGKPITLQGSTKAVLTCGASGYALHLKASWWVLKGFSVANSKKGIVLDGANHNILESVTVHHIEEEAVHFRTKSQYNTIQKSTIHNTGLKKPQFGEGLYIGSAKSNWAGKGPDQSSFNKALNNRFGPNCAAEAIDIKEGTRGGHIEGNFFDGTGQKGVNGGDSWIDLKGESYTIINNTGKKPLKDGIQIHKVANSVPNSGCNNTLKNNKCSEMPSGGRCVNDLTKSKCNKIS